MPLAEARSLLEAEGAGWLAAERSDAPAEQEKPKAESRKPKSTSVGFPLSAFGFSSHSAFFALHEPDADRAALLQLAAWCEQFSPHVGLDHHPQPQSLLLDVTGLGPLFGGEEALAWRMIEAFGRRGYWARVAVADTIGAAWAVSRFGADGRVGVHASACLPGSKASLSREQPQGGTPTLSAPRIIPPGEHVAALAPLAVEALRLPDPTLSSLHQLGLFQIGQVMELPRASLASRFQHEGTCVLIERLDQAFGAVEELVTPHRPPPEFRAEFCLEHPLARLWDVQEILAGLFDNVCRELAARGKGAVRSICRLDCEGGEVRRIELGLFQPTASPGRLLELAAMQLERMRLPGGVGRVGVEVEIAAPLSVRQQALFVEESRHRPRELAWLIDRLSSRLGPERVVRPRLLPDAQPERAYCEEALVGKPRKKSRKPKAESRVPLSSAFGFPLSAFERPLRLWSPPIPIEVVAVADGPPASFRVGRRRFLVHRWWGPERIETGWWRGRSVRRDYYQLETTTGARYWLYRHLRRRRWFLQGAYE
jgi:protein ImuB